IVDTLSIGANQVTVPLATSSDVEIRVTSTSASVGLIQLVLSNPFASPVLIWFNCQQAGYGPAICEYQLYRNSNLLRMVRNTSFDLGQQGSMAMSELDRTPPAGNSTYTVRAVKF